VEVTWFTLLLDGTRREKYGQLLDGVTIIQAGKMLLSGLGFTPDDEFFVLEIQIKIMLMDIIEKMVRKFLALIRNAIPKRQVFSQIRFRCKI
jgi:hypothetical protein